MKLRLVLSALKILLLPALRLLGPAFPWVITSLGAGYFLLVIYWAAVPRTPPSNEFNWPALASLPVVDRGRVQPIDTVARVNCLLISNRQDFVEEKDGAKRPALEWLLDTMVSGFGDPRSDKYQIFRIDNDQLVKTLKLPWRPSFLRYAFDEFKEHKEWLYKEALRVDDIPRKARFPFDVKVMDLAHHVQLYEKLAFLQAPFVVPPINANEDWLPIPVAHREDHPLTDPWRQILKAYLDNDPKTFNTAVAEYRKVLEEKLPDEFADARFESFFNRLEPFNKCIHLYICVFTLAVLAWLPLGFTKELNRAAFGLAAVVLVLHTSALIMRMVIQDRPPVTNLYSSAVFIGWGCVIVGLVLDWIFKNSIGLVVASVLGGTTLIIAQNLAQSGDTLEMMQAVLDTNFWLATHVTIVTFGYVATFVAGFMGVTFILLGVCTPLLDSEMRQNLTKMIYGVICFAMLLSFTGTVLGGIWADQSWGRFWGWDPKENGALMIVVWNALVLHARWAGIIKQRGLAVLAVGGNMMTAWSWFGTNLLGVGLHSYGFLSGAFFWLMVFVATQFTVMLIGAVIPEQVWWSNRARLAPVPAFKPPRL